MQMYKRKRASVCISVTRYMRCRCCTGNAGSSSNSRYRLQHAQAALRIRLPWCPLLRFAVDRDYAYALRITYRVSRYLTAYPIHPSLRSRLTLSLLSITLHPLDASHRNASRAFSIAYRHHLQLSHCSIALRMRSRGAMRLDHRRWEQQPTAGWCLGRTPSAVHTPASFHEL
jgi:hypothetical protein